MPSGQGCLWPIYSFDVIPLEFISSIYETFVTERAARDGIFYTPPHLVDFVLDQVLPWRGTDWNLKILDPACGSGCFCQSVPASRSPMEAGASGRDDYRAEGASPVTDRQSARGGQDSARRAGCLFQSVSRDVRRDRAAPLLDPDSVPDDAGRASDLRRLLRYGRRASTTQ